MADVDGVRVHFVHVRGGGIPLILSHGWPSAFVEFLPLVPLLTPAFDVVIPSLPGFGFSSRPARTLTTRDTAVLWHKLMRGLGYERYGAHGGDWGAAVTTYMALDDPGAADRHPLREPRQRARRDAGDRGRAGVSSPPSSAGTRASAATASSRARSRRRSRTA